MKKLALIFSVLCMALVFASCKDDDEPRGLPSEFKVSASQLTFLRSAATQNLHVVASSAPQVTADAAWLHIGSPALNGDSEKVYSVPVSADEHTGYDARTATITVTADGQTAKVRVVQMNASGIMLADGFTLPEIPAEGGQIVIPVLATGPFEAQCDSWIERVIPSDGARVLSGETTAFTIARNLSPQQRTGTIVLTLVDDPGATLSIQLSQAGSVASGTTDETAIETARNIALAVNIGNTLEATGGETAWGAAPVNEDYIRCIKASGFNAVRLPVAWYGHADPSTLRIDADWMNRVEEIVNLCVASDLYVFLNIHWDGGWMEEHIDSYSDEVNDIQRALWEQIAERFAYVGKHLVFCGANEAGKDTQASADALRAYMQTFIDVVRASGGNNATRVLAVQAPGTNIDNGVKYCQTLPSDPAPDRLMFEIHYYDPSDFTIMDSDGQWGAASKVKYFWGADFLTGTDRDCNYGDQAYLDDKMSKLKTNFVDKGIPVLMGEFGCARRTTFLASIDEDRHRRSRAFYHKCVVRTARNNGVIPCYWETPGNLFSRPLGVVTDPDNLNAMVEGAAESSYPF